MIKERSALIMMAVYNGEHYLRQQLDSILAQTMEDWELVIQDDGSTDGTKAILQEYCGRDQRISYRENPTGCHGAYCNFHALAAYCREKGPYRWYLFADQDDEWLPDKLEVMTGLLSGTKKPALAFADMDVIDGEGNRILDSVGGAMGCRYVNKASLFFSHIVFGCNTIMNDALFRAVPAPDVHKEETKILSHDNYYAKFAAVLGDVIYSRQITMHYRRHGENVTAGQKYSYGPARVLERMRDLQKLAKDHALTYSQSLIVISRLRDMGYDSARLRNIRRAILEGGPFALAVVRKYRVDWGKPVKTVSRCLILSLGMYKKYLTGSV